jgi:predicted GNAT family acetyltransferase
MLEANFPAHAVHVHRLTTGQETEVLAFLAARPVHTVTMASFIRDNGLVSPLNRGIFYACWNEGNKLEGVALMGHTLLFESNRDTAIEAFAHLAQGCPEAHLLMAEHEKVQAFWNHYTRTGDNPRLLRPVVLLEQREPFGRIEPVHGLRPATLDELETLMLIQAEMLFEETGINPLETDRIGFRNRCARRIEQQRSWVWKEKEGLIFKADIIAETPKSVYIEGVYVRPQARGRGYGRACLAQMGRDLLKRTESICLFVEEEDSRAQAFYRSIGYDFSSNYDLLYFNQRAHPAAGANAN